MCDLTFIAHMSSGRGSVRPSQKCIPWFGNLTTTLQCAEKGEDQAGQSVPDVPGEGQAEQGDASSALPGTAGHCDLPCSSSQIPAHG